MDEEIPYMGREDINELQEMLRWWKAQKTKQKQAPVPPLNQAVDMQVVRTPSGGIPGCLEPPPGTGTGTPHGNAGDRPGKATCDIYIMRHVTYLGTVYEEEQPTGGTLPVYNLNYTAVDGLQFITTLLGRDGRWYVPAEGLRFKAC